MNEDSRLKNLTQVATHFSSDSRLVGPGGIFVALKGQNVDGHDFVSEVLGRGSLAAIVERNVSDPRAVKVSNTQEAHWRLAGLFRDKFKGPLIAVGGSNGKTSTKEILYRILSSKFVCIKTEKSQNGLLGIPKTLEKLRGDTEMAVVEVGIDAPGDMSSHVKLLRPTHALLTSIGEEHLNLLGDLEGVFREERILVDETLRMGGKAYCPRSDPFLSRLKDARQLPARPQDLHAELQVDVEELHVLQNLTLACAVAMDLGMSPVEIRMALSHYSPPDGRGLKWKLNDSQWVIRDHYNANPSSMEASLRAAKRFSSELRLPLRLMLGQMLDLGPKSIQFHKTVVEKARALRPKSVLWVGSDFQSAAGDLLAGEYFLESSAEAISPEVRDVFLQPGVVLVKGSRGTAMERVMEQVFGNYSSTA